MTRIPGTSSTSGGNTSSSNVKGNDLRDVDLDQFLGLLITELQNQDPLNPMDNAQMLTQISTIREIGSTNQLTETLGNFAVGQELAMASNLIGKKVSGLDKDAKEIQGVVERVAVQTDAKNPSNRQVSVHVGNKIVDMKNIREIVSN
ncbi:MAG TPA: flagellar biosynthesis protein FlgD [Planctomycetaceae bacterium]|nr:flagellar biosynthesis protein FlgD [Planctomycetaceae bacterium]